MDKPNVLIWSDFIAATGFANQAHHIVDSIKDDFNIDVLAVNYFGQSYDREKFPYTIVPASDETSAFGYRKLMHHLRSKHYDILFILNDLYVLQPIAWELEQVLQETGTKLIFYYPIDCNPIRQDCVKPLQIAHTKIAYNKFGADAAKETGYPVDHIVPHGIDTNQFYPIDKAIRDKGRHNTWGIPPDSNIFVICNVNRNSPRKNVAQSLLAFAEFHKRIPASRLYLHMNLLDGAGAGGMTDLHVCIKNLGLEAAVLFPPNLQISNGGVSVEELNLLYNMSDCYLTTHLGGGWELTVVEAMSAGIPVICPDNTSMTEIVSTDRGYLYPMSEHVYIDSSGYRPIGHLKDIVEKLHQCHVEQKTNSNFNMKHNAKAFTQILDWSIISPQWLSIFNGVSK